MSTEHSLFTTALGLSAPWEVTEVRFDPKGGRIDFDVAFVPGSRLACPVCGAEAQAVQDTRARSWRHLQFFQFEAYLHASIPRVQCEQCGKTSQVPAPWARKGSGFTQFFEALVVALCQAMPVNTVAGHLNLGDDAVWRIVKHYVSMARAREDFSDVNAVGIDETASRRGQNYISVFHDLKAGRLLFACPARDHETFAADLEAHGGRADAVTAACIDLSKAYIRGVGNDLPKAATTFDVFHVIAMANKAVDEGRREEVRRSLPTQIAKEPRDAPPLEPCVVAVVAFGAIGCMVGGVMMCLRKSFIWQKASRTKKPFPPRCCSTRRKPCTVSDFWREPWRLFDFTVVAIAQSNAGRAR